MSIKLQTCQKFTWLIAIDAKTPDNMLTKIMAFTPENTELTIIRNDKFLRTVSHAAPYILTTRLDNDDILLPWAIGAIQDNINKKMDVEVLDLYGYQYDGHHPDGNALYYTSGRNRPNSPFLSVWEKNTGEKLKTCFYTNHTNMPDYFPARMILPTMPCYIQNIHQDCSMNKITGKPIMQ